jgi:hypothetical protein
MKHIRFAGFLAFSLSTGAFAFGCSSAPKEVARTAHQDIALCNTGLDTSKSLFVTDPVVLARFPLERVMDQITASASTTGQTGLDLYQQLFDTLNDSAHAVTSGPHCDDVLTGSLPSINGFPIECPRQEGTLASRNPFLAGDPDSFIPVAVVNRFDLAPSDGTNCGEYRIVYGKLSGQTTLKNRALVIFEAKLPNPIPDAGVQGCLPVVEFWASLTNAPDSDFLAARLEQFYFAGLSDPQGDFSPIVLAQNYGVGRGPDTGQIRANLFMNVVSGQGWELREFRLDQACDGYGNCNVLAENTVVQNNPFGGLFGGSDDASAAFQRQFLDQIATLASDTIPAIAMTTPAAYLGGESHEQGTDNDYTAQAANNSALLDAINAQLAVIGRRDLTAQNVLDRATTQSCAGCHQVATKRDLGGGLTWPASNFFTQVTETGKLSPALTDVFLPFRAQVMTSFLGPFPGCDSDAGDDGGSGDDGGGIDASYPPGVPTTVAGTARGAAN